MSPEDARLWAGANSLTDLCGLTARWLTGDIASQPGYAPGFGPDDESASLIETLVMLNRAGYLTAGSQPGERGPGVDGATWSLCAAVTGYATPETAAWLTTAATRAGFDVADVPATRPRWRRGHPGWPVTWRGDDVVTRFGGQRTAVDLADGWTGYGQCGPGAVAAVLAARQVTIVDPFVGRSELWPVLRSAAHRQAGCGDCPSTT
jgi:hypothetical protein